MNTVTYVPHCDPPCGLGSLEYTCPACQKAVRDYGKAALEYPDTFGALPTICPRCLADLMLDCSNDTVDIA